MHNRLLQNSIELYTTPDSYPVWKTKKPVVVIDDGTDSHSSLLHRYRYVAVTPGATIDWDLITKREHNEDDLSSTRNTTATTPPGSDVDEGEMNVESLQQEENVLSYEKDAMEQDDEEGDDDDEDEGCVFPPVLFENPQQEHDGGDGNSDAKKENKGHHKRSHSLFDAQGNPIVLVNSQEDEAYHPTGSAPVSTASFSSYGTERPATVLTWEAVAALPYRTRVLDNATISSSSDEEMEIVDTWNCGSDTTFAPYWNKSSTTDDSSPQGLTSTSVTNDTPMMETQNEDDDPMDATADDHDDNNPRSSIYIVCYHLPVILTKNNNEWTACWSESLIAKSEIQSVSSTRKTIWVGTVSNIPQEYLKDESERNAIRAVLQSMDCIPIFFTEEHYESVLEFMYLGFCKQVLWPSYHNVDLLDLATNGWGQRQRNTRADPVQACALAAAEARERKRSGSVGGVTVGGGVDGGGGGGGGSQKLRSDWDQVR